ncbi:MAG: hypothetical protein R3E42_17630 [Burkholderiaceae bacterium]
MVADVPGLIEGVRGGLGLGTSSASPQRTRVLLHLVDVAPFDDSIDPVVQAVCAIVAELKKFDQALYEKNLAGWF